MLGDGHLGRKGDGANAHLIEGRSTKDEPYLQYHFDMFSELLTYKIRNRGLTYSKFVDPITNYPMEAGYHTRSFQCLTPFHNRWYPKNAAGKYVKIIPNDLKLNSEIISTWFCDDGSICTWKLPYRFKIELAVNCFTLDEVMFLIELLEDRYNEKFRLKTLAYRTPTQYNIRAYDAAARPMIEDMDKAFPQGMNRKRLWDNPATRFYINPPPKQISKVEGVKIRKIQTIKFLSERDNFTIKEFSNYLDFNIVRYGNLYKYIKEYFDKGFLIKERVPAEDNRWQIIITNEGKDFFKGQK
jgi:hypothetical protein